VQSLRLRRRWKQFGLPLLAIGLLWLGFVYLPSLVLWGTWFRAALVAFLVWACLIETRRFQLTRIELPFVGLPLALDGLRIVQLSDLHVGAFGLTRWDFARVKRLVERAQPDLLVLTGDLVARNAYNSVQLRDALPPAPSLGAFAVFGNSDARHRDQVAEELRALGVTLLVNEHRVLERNGARFLLVGVDDPTEGRDDYARALEAAPTDCALAIVLAHAFEIGRAEDNAINATGLRRLLWLAGHTHGGQLRWPGPRPVGSREGGHTNVVNRIHVYISRGIGYVFPMRWCCPPEVTVFVLRRA